MQVLEDLFGSTGTQKKTLNLFSCERIIPLGAYE
jgi:hypothetical protein